MKNGLQHHKAISVLGKKKEKRKIKRLQIQHDWAVGHLPVREGCITIGPWAQFAGANSEPVCRRIADFKYKPDGVFHLAGGGHGQVLSRVRCHKKLLV